MENKTIYSEVDLSIRVSPLQSSDEENNIDKFSNAFLLTVHPKYLVRFVLQDL
jgi:hypothetical protein